jgi:hypothetical protein
MDYHQFVKQVGKRAWCMCISQKHYTRGACDEWLRRAYPSKSQLWRHDAVSAIHEARSAVLEKRCVRESLRYTETSCLSDRLWRYTQEHARNLAGPGTKYYHYGTSFHFTRVKSLNFCGVRVVHNTAWVTWGKRSYPRKQVTYYFDILRGMTRLRHLIPESYVSGREWGVLGAVERGVLYGFPVLNAVIVTRTRTGCAARNAILVCNGKNTTACADIHVARNSAYKMRCMMILQEDMSDAWSAALASKDKFLEKSLLTVANERVNAMEAEVC